MSAHTAEPSVVLLDNGWVAVHTDGSKQFPWRIINLHGPDANHWSWHGLEDLGIAAVLHRGQR